MIEVKDILTPEAGLLLQKQGDVYVCMDEPFRQKLQSFLPAFEKARASARAKIYFETNAYPRLPYGQPGFEWAYRIQSLKIAEKRLKNFPVGSRILEVGSFNGWLSNRLTEMGFEVLATDYFLDERDGLQSQKFYPRKWTALQMDLADPTIFNPNSFDVIIINHGLQFMKDPVGYMSALHELVSSRGEIMVLGMHIYKNDIKKAADIKAYRSQFKEKYGFDMAIHPSKGYLDWNDKKALKTAGLLIKPYPGMVIRNLASNIISSRPAYYYGLASKV